MRLAYVVPRYGPQILGGAETLARTTVEHLVQCGHYVEVWTTCAQNPYTQVNEYPAGVEQHNGITVRRFPAQIHRRFNPWVEPFTRENQYLWVDSLLHSPQLYDYIADHNDAFDYLVFIPYVAGTTYYGAHICPQKSIVWTCMHDEWPAYLAPTRELLSDVAGIILNSQAEKEFLEKTLRVRYPDRMVAGTGVDVVPGDAAAFRQAYPHVPEQFFVYAGRLDEGKNVHELLRYYSEYRSRHDPHPELVLLGEGPLGEEEHPGVIRLGFVDESTKRNALAACTFLCQPSLAESFSIVLLEAWVQRRPVLVRENCAVTLGHVRESQGGLYFANYGDFEGAVEYLLTHPDQASQMGVNGYLYVARNYNWQVIVDRVEQALLNWSEPAR